MEIPEYLTTPSEIEMSNYELNKGFVHFYIVCTKQYNKIDNYIDGLSLH